MKARPTPGALPASSDLLQPGSTQNEAGCANCDPHALNQGEHSSVRAGHAPLRKAPHSSIE
jgi:hypothetical protein